MPFTHLHVHSEYSLLDGACRIKDLVRRVKEMGQTAVAITDHGVMYGAIAFYKECKKQGIKPIIGCEVYVAPRTRFDKEHGVDSDRHHLVLLCKNEEGYRNLCYMVSKSFVDGFYTRPRVDMELIRNYSGGLIALSACIQGHIPKLILNDEYEEAKNKALELQEIFGDDSFYLEIQDHGLPEERAASQKLIRLSEETGIPLVVTNDAHYITRDDAAAQDVLMCIQTGKTVDDTDRMRFTGSDMYLKTEAEMRMLFPDVPEAADNTVKIAEMCQLEFQFGHYHLPEFKLPEGVTAKEHIKKLCLEGFKKKYTPDREDVLEQMDYELQMIDRMGFTDYFLIVADFVGYAKDNGIPVGPGRGSAAGSVVSYCLNITDVDPIKYNLYFERFLNPERVSMPDIDMDFCERRRSEVVDYVKRKYGADRVAQIITFNTLKAKNAVRSVSKALGLTFQEENELAKSIPNALKITLKESLEISPQLREMYDGDERIKRVVDTAMAIEDMPKDSGTHAAGIVITRDPVHTYVPLALSKKDNTIATQYTMTTIEELGLLKMDFLGLRNLTIIDDAVRDIRASVPDFDIRSIPDDDQNVYNMISSGRTAGVFQLESTGMTGVCTGLKPKSIEDITAVIALYRPGPMDSIPRFIESASNPEKIRYKHPLLEPILDVTYGCIVYQEQVIEIFRRLAGFSLGQADMIRRAMSKKHMDEIIREKEAFINGDPERNIHGAVAKGISPEIAGSIYDEILDFANYAFNKAHAVSYAIVAYQTAYLKYHYPRQYMAALMSSVLDSAEKISGYTGECLQMGIKLLPPDVNQSRRNFTVVGNDIRYGLAAVKNIGGKFIDTVVEERERAGKFTSFEDFCERMYGTEMNRRAVESLIKCGAFDSLGLNRRQLMEICEPVLEAIALSRRKNVEGQLDLFGFGGEEETVKPGRVTIPNVPDYSASERMAMEREVTGLYLSGHPMDDHRPAARKLGAVSIGRIMAEYREPPERPIFRDGQDIIVAGAISTARTRLTKNNTNMGYITLDDGSGAMEVICFDRTLQGANIAEGTLVCIRGRLSLREDKEPQMVANRITDLEVESQRATGAPAAPAPQKEEPSLQADKKIYVRLKSQSDPVFQKIKLILNMFPGHSQMVIYFEDTKKRVGTRCLMHTLLVNELRERLGAENVVIK